MFKRRDEKATYTTAQAVSAVVSRADMLVHGNIECVEARAVSVGDMLARLVSVLDAKGLLDSDEVVEVLGYPWEAVDAPDPEPNAALVELMHRKPVWDK